MEPQEVSRIKAKQQIRSIFLGVRGFVNDSRGRDKVHMSGG